MCSFSFSRPVGNVMLALIVLPRDTCVLGYRYIARFQAESNFPFRGVVSQYQTEEANGSVSAGPMRQSSRGPSCFWQCSNAAHCIASCQRTRRVRSFKCAVIVRAVRHKPPMACSASPFDCGECPSVVVTACNPLLSLFSAANRPRSQSQ